MIRNGRQNAGFSIVDVLLAMGMIVILITISYPYVETYLNAQKERKEKDVQARIVKSLAAMAERQGAVPVGNDMQVAAAALTEFSNLSEDEIRYDAWRQGGDADGVSQRFYRFLQVQRVYRDVVLDINYVFLLSLGEDGCVGIGENAACGAGDVANYVNGLLTTEEEFRTQEAQEGDVLSKYTDVKLRTDQYETTRMRLEAIANALTEYSTIKRYEGIIRGDDSTSIYYPPSSSGYDAALYPMSADDAAFIVAELNGGNVIRMGAGDESRLDDMQALMRIIGLPEEYCCTPLFRINVGGEQVEQPFYYYTNARVRRSNGTCNNVFPIVGDRKLPARVTVTPDACG